MAASLTALAGVTITLSFLFFPLKMLGIWDPYELDAADRARRIAIWLLPHPSTLLWQSGARAESADPLWLPGAQNAMPTLSDLGMGELPFTSMAVSFRLFGLHEWTGRVPLALWGAIGAIAAYALIARLVDRRAALYTVTALVTMPLYFLHARTMLGDIVTMSALVLALAGLAGLILDRGALVRVGWGAIAIIGLVSGYLSRGALIGVAIPALAAGLTGLVLEAGARPAPKVARRDLAALIASGIALGTGIFAAAGGLWLLHHADPAAPLSRHLGLTVLFRAPTESTFDLPLRDLGHGLFPWSAFLPFAVGRLFRRPPISGEDEDALRARERETGLRVLLLIALGTSLVTYAVIAPRAGALPFSGPFIGAAIAAMAIRDFERGAPPSPAIAVSVLVLGYVLYTDIARGPVRALAAFAVDDPTFPESFETEGTKLMKSALVLFAGLVALAWLEDPKPRASKGFVAWLNDRTDAYIGALKSLSEVWAGNLVFLAVVLEAALVGLGAMVLVGRRLGWSAVARLPKNFADASVNVWWIAPVTVFAVPIVYLAVRDAFRKLTHALRVPRALPAMLAAVVAGGVLAFGYYPALAAQLSPKEAFETYSKLSGSNEPLALLGVRARAAVYYGAHDVASFESPEAAFEWLTREGGPKRKWLIFKAENLPKLNSLHRKNTGANLPVLDGRSSQIFLASNEPGRGPDANPLSEIVLSEAPRPTHRNDATLGGELTALGWDVVDEDGKVVETVVPQKSYHLRLYFRVEKPIYRKWKAFVHIDGFGRRYNGDHTPLEGRYPMSLWHPGDIVVDDLVFQLEPNFLPGDYTVFYGFFSGDTRFPVTSGAAQDNRVVGGPLRVR